MHVQVRKFIESVKARYPYHFEEKRVIECGSLNVNGGINDLFTRCMYTGVDVLVGPNVNVIAKVHELEYEDGHFDVVVSTEMLEHDMYWRSSLAKMVKMLKAGGLMILTCAAPGREEHGTIRSAPHASGTTQIGDMDWANYYRALTKEDIMSVLDTNLFAQCEFSMNGAAPGGTKPGTDLYFWGIKRGELEQPACL